MTREEAIKIAAECKFIGSDSGSPGSYCNRVIAENFVLSALALGMLKLDEPAKLSDKLLELVSDTRLVRGERHERMLSLFVICDELGLKIVEK